MEWTNLDISHTQTDGLSLSRSNEMTNGAKQANKKKLSVYLCVCLGERDTNLFVEGCGVNQHCTRDVSAAHTHVSDEEMRIKHRVA